MVIDFAKNVVKLKPQATVKASTTVKVDPHSEVMTMGVIKHGMPDGIQGIFMGTRQVNKLGLIPAKVLCLTSETKIPVRFLNPNDYPIRINKHTKLGIFQVLPESCVIETIDFDDEKNSQSLASLSTSNSEPTGDCDDAYSHLKFDLSDSDLTDNQKKQLRTLLYKYRHAFVDKYGNLGETNIMEMEINLVPGTRPHRAAPYRCSPKHREIIDQEVQKLCQQRIVEPSNSPFASPVVLVRKPNNNNNPNNNQWRFCVDYIVS